MIMAFCIDCGTKLPDGARFCPSCGTAVVLPEVASVEVAEPVAEVAVVDETPVMEVPAEEVTVSEVAPVDEQPVQENIQEENVYAAEFAQIKSEEVMEEPACEEAVCEQEPAQTAEAVPCVISQSPQSDTYTPSSTKEEQQACLDNIYARLRNERLCWKIFGFVWIGYAALFTILAFAISPMIIYAILFAPLAVISFVMVSKVNNYMNSLYTDCEPAVTRCSSVGMIVFGAFFNTVAMIFIIINFVNVKTNEKTLKDIKHNQNVYNNRI